GAVVVHLSRDRQRADTEPERAHAMHAIDELSIAGFCELGFEETHSRSSPLSAGRLARQHTRAAVHANLRFVTLRRRHRLAFSLSPNLPPARLRWLPKPRRAWVI